MNTEFLATFSSKTLRRNANPKCKIGKKNRFFTHKVQFTKSYKPHYTLEFFETVEVACRKLPTYTKKLQQTEVVRGIIYQKNDQNHLAINSSAVELAFKASAQPFADNTLMSLRENIESVGAMEYCSFRIVLPINVPKNTEEVFFFFDSKRSISLEVYCLEPCFYSSITIFVKTMNTLNQEARSEFKSYHSEVASSNAKH